jgi:hypothetical protein
MRIFHVEKSLCACIGANAATCHPWPLQTISDSRLRCICSIAWPCRTADELGTVVSRMALALAPSDEATDK